MASTTTAAGAATEIAPEAATRLLHLEDTLGRRVLGQDDVLAAVAGAIRRARAGLTDPQRPVAGFLFLGPTGVGKTELAKALAGALFGEEAALFRLDLSEYQAPAAVWRLYAAPAGTGAHRGGGQLIEAMRRRPEQVVLFDEVERAHPDVLHALGQILGEGRLADPPGQPGQAVDFRSAVVIVTTSAGGTGNGSADASSLPASLRPDFANLFDEVVVFQPLEREHVRTLVEQSLRDLRGRLDARRITLELTAAARDWLAERGADRTHGLRPLRRLIQRAVANPLACRLLAGEVGRGDRVLVDVAAADRGGADGGLVVARAA